METLLVTIGIAIGLAVIARLLISLKKDIKNLKGVKECTDRVIVKEINSEIEVLRAVKTISKQELDRYGEFIVSNLISDFAKEIAKNCVQYEMLDSYPSPHGGDMKEVRMTCRVVKKA